MSIFEVTWDCMVVYYVKEVGKRCILVGYYSQGAVVARFLKNFVYACMDIIRPEIPVSPPPLLSFVWCLTTPVRVPCTILTEVKSLVEGLSWLYLAVGTKLPERAPAVVSRYQPDSY